jgi:hypothetical protein
MQTVFNTDFHLDRVVAIWWHPERVYPKVFLLVHVRHSPRYRDPDEIPTPPSVRNIVGYGVRPCLPEFHVDALVTFVLLLNVLEQKIKRLCLPHLPRRGELL